VGADQAVSKARLTIDAAWSDESHVARNVETFRLPLHYINPAVRWQVPSNQSASRRFAHENVVHRVGLFIAALA
jgi:hypothetical protein